MKLGRFFGLLAPICLSACGMTDDPREDEKRLSYPSIPDPAFEHYLLESYDLNGDGLFSYYEAERVLVIDCSGRGVASLAGIEHFVQLRELYCSDNQIENLDLGENLELQVVDCARNNLITIDVEALLALHTLDCSENELSTLELVRTPALWRVNCSANDLTVLDVSNCARPMELVDARFNPMDVLYIGRNQQIKNLQPGSAEVREK